MPGPQRAGGDHLDLDPPVRHLANGVGEGLRTDVHQRSARPAGSDGDLVNVLSLSLRRTGDECQHGAGREGLEMGHPASSRKFGGSTRDLMCQMVPRHDD